MNDTFNFDIAFSLLGEIDKRDTDTGAALSARGKKYKDCSAKFVKVKSLENDLCEKEIKKESTGKDARDAWDVYKIWWRDPVRGPEYHKIYLKKVEIWGHAQLQVIEAKKKLHEAQQAAWDCEATNHFD